MQALIVQVATTFVADAAVLVNGFGRVATHVVMAPIERIANACDVAGILAHRRAEKNRPTTGFVVRNSIPDARRRRSHRRGGRLGCMRFLGDLT